MVDSSYLISSLRSYAELSLRNTPRVEPSPGWSNRLFSKAAASDDLRRTQFGMLKVRAMREQCWRPVSPSWKIADARQGTTRFGYDQNGNLLSVKDAKLQPTTYAYDSMDRLFTRKDALNRQESYQYDPAGNLNQFTDRKTQAATFTYDALNRRTRADYADSSFTTFTYDAVGRLTRATDSTSDAIDFYYDNLDRLILEVTPQGAVAYEYDAIGRRTKMTVAGQAPVTYQYDAASRLTQVAQSSLVVGLGYDAAGRRTSLMYPNGTSTSYAYDNASRLTIITHNGPGGVIESLTYTYDSAGNRTSLNRANGTASLLPSAVTSATYDAANEQTAFAGGMLTYDQNGNLTNDGTNTYTWDARNRLIAISGGVAANFSYDALGRRASKTISGITTQFAYDGNDIVAEIGGGAVEASYLRSLNVDEAFVRQSSSNEFYHTDVLGSSLALSNAAGSSAVTYNYDPFGKTTISGTSLNLFQYTGRENDGTGLFYYRARYYSASSMRFTSEDPLHSKAPSENAYVYASNNPYGEKDPTGKIPIIVGVAILGGVYGALSEGGTAFLAGEAIGTILSKAGTGALAGSTASVVGAFTALGTKNPALVGALSAEVYSLIKQKLGSGCVDPVRLAADAGLGALLGPLVDKLVPKVRGPEPNIFVNRDLLAAGPKTQRILDVENLAGYFSFVQSAAEELGGRKDCSA